MVAGSSCSKVTDKKKQGLLYACILGSFGRIKEKRKLKKFPWIFSFLS